MVDDDDSDVPDKCEEEMQREKTLGISKGLYNDEDVDAGFI
jgi:hypothetical protein